MAGQEIPRIDLADKRDSLTPYPYDALRSSASLDWNGLYMQEHRQPPHQMAEHSCRQHRIIIHDRTLQFPMSATIEELSDPVQIMPTATGGLPTRKLQQVVDYIQAHLEQDLSLSDLAAVVHMSPSYFSGLFKQATGFAPHQYLIQCRIERAKQLLLQTELPIADIAQALGFAHQSHFSRHFKRLVGVTPKAFLKRQ